MHETIKEVGLSRRSVLKAAALAGVGTMAGAMFSGCAPSDAAAKNVGASAHGGAGTCQATVPSMKGDITVFVTVGDDSIERIDVVDEVDSPVIRDAAIEGIVSRIIEQQNIDVDTVTGATMTSMAIINGVKTALENGGHDTKAYSHGIAEVEKKQKPDEAADVVIVGSGMAGLSAAINALQNGAEKVIVLEKQAFTGGSTRVCGGGIWAVGSLCNEIADQDCSVDEYIDFMTGWSAPTQLNIDLLTNIHATSSDTFSYIYDWGLPVSVSSWSLGNPDVGLPCFWATNGLGKPWENGTSGVADFMATRASLDGAEIRLNSRVVTLASDGGTVVGVQVEDEEGTYTIKAKKTILASGGFTRNDELIDKYAPDFKEAFAFTSGGCTGDGIAMTEELGAQVVGTGMMGLVGLNSSHGYYGEFGSLVNVTPVTVNAAGKTFIEPGTFYGKTLKLLIDQPGSCAYGVADSASKFVDRFEKAVELGYMSKYDSLDELAKSEGIEADGLKSVAAEREVSQAPFYCIVKRPLFIGSIPGLKVNEKCEVLNAEGAPIENLYAAGELIFGNVFSNCYPASGTGVGTSCYTGTIAGKNAAGSLA